MAWSLIYLWMNIMKENSVQESISSEALNFQVTLQIHTWENYFELQHHGCCFWCRQPLISVHLVLCSISEFDGFWATEKGVESTVAFRVWMYEAFIGLAEEIATPSAILSWIRNILFTRFCDLFWQVLSTLLKW